MANLTGHFPEHDELRDVAGNPLGSLEVFRNRTAWPAGDLRPEAEGAQGDVDEIQVVLAQSTAFVVRRICRFLVARWDLRRSRRGQ